MQQELKDKWIANLLSGQYTQGRHLLIDDQGGKTTHCCLGVLCETAGLNPILDERELVFGYTLGNEDDVWSDVLSDDMLKKFGLRSSEQLTLAHMNDGEEGHKQCSFVEIAEYIKVYITGE